ncbi:MAG: hypothetical protein KTR15_15410 [Phycisphaeraceae bacterium]|nr:hypothetical protein [Phycisphaeraceae bacterium]
MKRLIAPLLLCLALLVGCQTGPAVDRIDNPIIAQYTIDNIGACQGVFVWEGSVWMYGDRGNKGVIKRLEWIGPNDEGKPMLRDAGETYELMLYRNRFSRTNEDEQLPRNLIPHPTGLTHHPKYDAFIGNTVDQKGTIYSLHFLGLTESGSLDDWITNKVIDDLATNGTRPEFVRWNGRWLIATADYGDKDNKLRLYDPEKLKTAKKTSDPGVLIAAFNCGPFVQSMHWIDQENTLVLAQNQTAGLGYRLTLLDFTPRSGYLRHLESPTVKRIIDLGQPTDELEGFAIVAPGWAIMTSAMEENNATVIRWPIKSK